MEIDATMWAGVRQAPAARHLDVVLKPLSRPELGEIRIDAAVFAIGRIEDPFASYGNDILNMLSRRHASIFRKDGFVYLVDLQSRNGTTVNRVGIGQEPCQLRDGDEICFGGSLSYRIQITPRVRPEGSLTLRLTPESGDSGLEPIAIAKFPFLVSKTDGIFSNYKSDGDHGGELRYLSRRHAHIYQKGNEVYIGDLGSANGTFLEGQRLQEQAMPLQDGALIAFGGKHFVYRVSIVRQAGVEPADDDMSHHLTERRTVIRRPPAVAPQAAPAEVSPQIADKPAAAVGPKPESKPQATALSLKVEGKSPATAVSPRAVVTPTTAASAKTVASPTTAASAKTVASPKAVTSAKTVASPKAATTHKAVTSLKTLFSSKAEIKAPAEVKSQAEVRPPAEPKPRVAEAKPPLAEAKPQPAAASKPATASQLAAAPKPATASQLAAAPKPAAASQPAAALKPTAASQPAAAPQRAAAPQPAAAPPPPAGDLNALAMDSGTQFMAAPTSFLTVLCAADQPKKDAAPAAATAPAAVATKEPPAKRRRRGRAMVLFSELITLIKGDPDSTSTPRRRWRLAAIVGALVVLALTAYIWNASERALKNAIAHNDYTRAATLAARLLEKHPDDVELKARATEVGLKATVPTWLQKVRARDFDGAKSALTGMSDLSKRDSDLRPLIDELDWLGNLERLVSDRGGPEAPIRIYADEDNIEHLIGRWNEDTGEHQRALNRIASYVPQFGDWYGEALTHLRRLQSESTVYLPVVERVKTNITAELARDNPDVLKPILKEIAEKYPRLGGMDDVRQDLARYIEIRHEARSRKSGRLFALLEKARFVTPPFQQSFHTLSQGRQLPPADLLRQYDAATRAWKEHNPTDALSGLQKLTTGPWGEGIAVELERRRGVAAGFAALQQARNANDYVDQLLAFRGSLDADEDVYFLRATAADLNQQKDKVIARAQDAMNQARTLWQEYRSNGAIDASQRIETSISDEFRTRAHLLAEASKHAQQSLLLYSQVDAAGAAQGSAIRDEIEAEAREQRSRLRDLSNVVEPALLQTKLALLGDSNE